MKTNKCINILGVHIDNVDFNEARARVQGFMETNKSHLVVTPNPEIVMQAQTDRDYMDILSRSELVIADGIGIIIAAKLLGRPLKGRVTGCDLSHELMSVAAKTGKSVYLLGGQPGIAQTAAEKMRKKYPGVNICGHHHGYFDADGERVILEEIRAKKPDIMIIGFSMVKAEKWADAHRDLPVKVMLCVGGTIDIMAENVKRAPVFFQRIGMEWFWRAMLQPSRWRRLLVLPKFLLSLPLRERGLK